MAGLWTVQDTGAQLVGDVAAPRAGMRILDACAGVGGKSTHLAELTDDKATIDAADLNQTKLDLCAQTAQRLGLASIRRIAVDLLDTKAPLGNAYDLIVLDAPCSGLGVLRRHPDAKWRLKPDDVPRLADLQRQLLDAVVPRLAPNGALIYSVCTFTGAEGPDQVAALVARTDLRLVAKHRSWPPDADAFYIARLER
jgi:16S rRNA (cytosine967-C5)-methyltransferase